jgi:hypothetical protein
MCVLRSKLSLLEEFNNYVSIAFGFGMVKQQVEEGEAGGVTG